MIDAVFARRIQFAFTVMFHYLFPILTMGLGFFVALLSTLHLATGKEHYAQAARFWAGIFAINFALGVVTGIPLEFEFGTNWSRFSPFGGGVFGQTLPLEGVCAFFLESGFLGLFLFGEGRVSRTVHWLAGLGVAADSLLSGYFIVATDASGALAPIKRSSSSPAVPRAELRKSTHTEVSARIKRGFSAWLLDPLPKFHCRENAACHCALRFQPALPAPAVRSRV